MVARAPPTPPQRQTRPRPPGATLQPADRRDPARAGWRTPPDLRENNVRARDGRLRQVEQHWHPEAERDPAQRGAHGVDFVHATAESVDEVWSKLRRQAELADVRRRQESRYQAAVQAS